MKIITTHKNTDFDALASVIAATILYPGAIGVIPKMVNRNVEKFLSTHKTAFNIVLPHEIEHEEVDTLIVVDTHCWKRLDRMEKLRQRDDLVIHIWDHHEEGDINASWQCIEPVGATVTLLVRELQRRKICLTPLDSTVLLIGLYEDTGHLSYPLTGREDAAAAEYLLGNCADLNVASFFLNPPYEEVQRDVLFKLIENTEKISHRKILIGINIVKLEKNVPMLASIVSMYRKLISTEVVFAIFVNNETSCTVIARSANERVDVAAVLGHFGGGGHPGAASATIKLERYSPESVKEKIIRVIRENRINRATIADLMSYPVTMVSPDTPMEKIREIMEEKGIRGILVGTEEDLEGIIVLWDLKKIKQDRQWKAPVKAFMARNVTTIPPNIDPAEAAQIMVQRNIGHLPVEHQGRIIGILTRTDMLTFFYDMLPD
ncbi:CBS domain-containing protein [Desulfopila inferna]|uniref:CBS domain-containing protein n=1 Tax=Desulfopila inferna TaxID=468528 RepID=UPI0019662A92|nr:CBS domain-containing protein [Desulfopila inferna]MBM9603855.1 CBS domain-containing protein [Desulfopila inferna]